LIVYVNDKQITTEDIGWSSSNCIKCIEDLENVLLLLHNVNICNGCDNFNNTPDIKSKLGPHITEFNESWYHSKCTVLLKSNTK